MRLTSSPMPATAAVAGAAGASAPAAEEAGLLRQAQGGDRAAFARFIALTQDRLYTVLVRIVGDRDEAAELAQETYLRALAGLGEYRGAAAPYTWLYRIGVNLAIARLRKVRRQRTFSLGDGAGGMALRSAGPGPDAGLLSADRARALVAALGRLDSEYRAVLIMRDVDDMDYAEIGEVMGLPLGTVKSRLFRARTALRGELQRSAPWLADDQGRD